MLDYPIASDYTRSWEAFFDIRNVTNAPSLSPIKMCRLQN